ncbi:geranylgeranyl transferase type-2 subunit alpha [Galendromus occidentalis]|uniref:Geranylgeranyl transferase type-2 subunit alpha n=1 Tax=Galendromus occidentalis TaxID=34638 RepID=A0AAJ7L635_9ACAR|nr:geranylgeranyl transferase type-2 subunit alpha [Galendromus occidentalis]
MTSYMSNPERFSYQHGRVKVKTTAQQAEEKRLEREKKKAAYLAATGLIYKKRTAGELDDELLNYTAGILMNNPDDSTLWNIRREIFLKMKADGIDTDGRTKDELSLTQQTLMKNPKSYGSWFHRGWTNENLPDSPDWKKELELSERFLEKDDRNFHCWDYRRFLVAKNSVSDAEELEFSRKRINSNFSNYSSWHYRSKLLPKLTPGRDGVSIEKKQLEAEFKLVLNAAFTDPQDQSAWMYHRWLLGKEEPKGALMLLKWYPKERSVLAVFDKALTENTLPVEAPEGQVLEGPKWEKVGGLPAAWVWRYQYGDLGEPESIVVGSTKLCLSCTEYRSDLGAETPESLLERRANLQWQLESTEQIIEMEPDSKWPLLTSVVLLHAMKPDPCHLRKYRVLDKLKEVDPYRKNYYDDLKSKLLIEDHLKPNTLEVDLSSLGLTSLHGCHLMATAEKLDLSNNQLTLEKLRHLRNCARLKSLIVTGNAVTKDDVFDFLPSHVHIER